MAGINEQGSNTSQFEAAIKAGLEALDLNKEITFQAYSRTILPIDGYIFWTPTVQICAKGSVHVSSEFVQNEDESLGSATLTFTSESRVAEFDCSPPNTIFVTTIGKYRYAFAAQQPYYAPMNLWHYFGHNVAPAMATQLLDGPNYPDPTRAIVSNSLPIWLSMNNYPAPYAGAFSNNITIYPSFLVSPNLVPPYAAVHIDNDDTTPIQPIPFIDPYTRSHYQQASDRVRITFYGLQNNEVQDFMDFVEWYSLWTAYDGGGMGTIGIMNMPIPKDVKRTQAELQTIAMKKQIDFTVSYYQTRVNDIAQQLILSVIPTFIIG